MKNGFLVVAVCTSGAQTISSLEGLNGGIIISGYRFEDMLFKDLYQNLPENFEMLLVASQNRVGDDLDYKHLVYLPMPLKVHDLIATLSMICLLYTSSLNSINTPSFHKNMVMTQVDVKHLNINQVYSK